MKLAMLCGLVCAIVPAQRIPGLGTDPIQKNPRPQIVKARVDPPDRGSAEATHSEALAGLSSLIEEATALRSQLQTDGSAKLRADALRRIDSMKKRLKSVEAAIKGK